MNQNNSKERVEQIVENFNHHLYNGYDSFAKKHLRDSIHQELQKAREEERERILVEISHCQQEHNPSRHGDSVDDAYDRVHDYIRFTHSELDQLDVIRE